MADEKNPKKKKYNKPKIESEKLMAYGALCDGMAGGGKKDSTAMPTPGCDTPKLFS